MPSAALEKWRADRLARLAWPDGDCAAVPAAEAARLEECLRGYVMHLSAHFQGFCRDLYRECVQACAGAVPAGLQAAVWKQFSSELALERGNPSNENVIKDFNRFGLSLNLAASDPASAGRVTDLGHLMQWRNRAGHGRPNPAGGGAPGVLTLAVIRQWVASCDGLAASLDAIMEGELRGMVGAAPW